MAAWIYHDREAVGIFNNHAISTPEHATMDNQPNSKVTLISVKHETQSDLENNVARMHSITGIEWSQIKQRKMDLEEKGLKSGRISVKGLVDINNNFDSVWPCVGLGSESSTVGPERKISGLNHKPTHGTENNCDLTRDIIKKDVKAVNMTRDKAAGDRLCDLIKETCDFHKDTVFTDKGRIVSNAILENNKDKICSDKDTTGFVNHLVLDGNCDKYVDVKSWTAQIKGKSAQIKDTLSKIKGKLPTFKHQKSENLELDNSIMVPECFNNSKKKDSKPKFIVYNKEIFCDSKMETNSKVKPVGKTVNNPSRYATTLESVQRDITSRGDNPEVVQTKSNTADNSQLNVSDKRTVEASKAPGMQHQRGTFRLNVFPAISGHVVVVAVICVLLLQPGRVVPLSVDVFLPLTCDSESSHSIAPGGHNSSYVYTSTLEQTLSLSRTDYYNNVPNFDYVIHDSCNEALALSDLVHLLGNSSYGDNHIVIGPSNYGLCEPIARLSEYYHKTLLSWRCSGSSLDNSATYPTFMRTVPSNTLTSGALGAILLKFLWKRVAIVTSAEYPCYRFSTDVYIDLTAEGYIVDQLIEVAEGDVGVNRLTATFRGISTDTKAIIICASPTILPTISASLVSAGLDSGRHAFIVIHTHSSLQVGPEGAVAWAGEHTQSFVRNAILLYAHPDSLMRYEAAGYTPTNGQYQWSDTYLHNAVSLIVASLSSLTLASQPVTQQNILNIAHNITFQGLYGNLSINNGALQYHYSGWDYQGGVFVPVFEVSPSGQVTSLAAIDWTDGVGPGEAYCDFHTCEEQGFNLALIPVIILPSLALVAAGIGAGLFVRRRMILKEMEKGPNKIILLPDDLIFVSSKAMGKSLKSLSSHVATSQPFERPDIIKNSEPSASMGSFPDAGDFGDTARYNGDIVFVKQLDISGFELKSKVRNYLKTMRDLRHENLNPFVGCYVEPATPSLVWDHCTRRSLEDVIANEDMKLDWDFKLSLLTDLVRGLKYLHSSVIKVHGALKSGNCVIDSRWVLKITDFGVVPIYEKYQVKRDFQPKDLLWTAPERLRDPQALYGGGTPKGDVFAFAIIMQEVIVRGHPYCMLEIDPAEIIKKVRKPPPLCRPSVSQGAAPPQYIQIMKQCWSEMPDMRPDFEEINREFKDFNRGKKMNIVDTMFKMLEKYSNDLEETVHVRTLALEDEKKKTENLLSQMLPATVAHSLMTGEPVEAESFDHVTIYFSDIVGFTTISAMSTPLQVVDLLNDLYTAFDSTMDEYDVYKVETIGDAYMVCSGLPLRNGNRHAGEIGTLALHLLHECGKFTIRHMPEVPLRLRIGIHSGSCVAGVVGLRMPRYCLFGDTVNTASRMESTGLPFRVHVSPTTYEILVELGGFHLEFRGETELKGKGIVKSYWLTGRDGFHHKIPEPPPITGENNHGLNLVNKINMNSLHIATSNTPESVINSNNVKYVSSNNSQPLSSSNNAQPAVSSSLKHSVSSNSIAEPSSCNLMHPSNTIPSNAPSTVISSNTNLNNNANFTVHNIPLETLAQTSQSSQSSVLSGVENAQQVAVTTSKSNPSEGNTYMISVCESSPKQKKSLTNQNAVPTRHKASITPDDSNLKKISTSEIYASIDSPAPITNGAGGGSPPRKSSVPGNQRRVSAGSVLSPKRKSSPTKQQLQTISRQLDSIAKKYTPQMPKTSPMRGSRKISPVPGGVDGGQKHSSSKRGSTEGKLASRSVGDVVGGRKPTVFTSVSETEAPGKRGSIDSVKTDHSAVSTTTIQIQEKPGLQVSKV